MIRQAAILCGGLWGRLGAGARVDEVRIVLHKRSLTAGERAFGSWPWRLARSSRVTISASEGGLGMPSINVAEAKAKLSQLLDRASAGEEIVIARAGKPVARLVALDVVERRKPGAWRGWRASAEALLGPMDPEDLDAAEGKFSDEYGISLPRSGRS